MKNTKLRKEEGITLVALVITIVVLLILAAVAIVALSGENNIITRAQAAKDNYNVASINEEQKLGEYDKSIEQYLGKNGSDPIIGTYKFIGDGWKDEFTFSQDGTLTRVEDEGDPEPGTWKKIADNEYEISVDEGGYGKEDPDTWYPDIITFLMTLKNTGNLELDDHGDVIEYTKQ